MLYRDYFDDPNTAWIFAKLLPKTRYTVIDYGKDDTGYYIEYKDHPEYAR